MIRYGSKIQRDELRHVKARSLISTFEKGEVVRNDVEDVEPESRSREVGSEDRAKPGTTKNLLAAFQQMEDTAKEQPPLKSPVKRSTSKTFPASPVPAQPAQPSKSSVQKPAQEAKKEEPKQAKPPKEEPKPTEAPKVEQPKVAPKPTEAPKPQPPKVEPKPTKAPQAEQPKVEPKPTEAPKPEQPKVVPKPTEAPKSEPSKVEQKPAESLKPEQPKQDPKPAEAPKVEQPKEEPKLMQAPKPEEPKNEPKPVVIPKAEEPREEPKPSEAPKPEKPKEEPKPPEDPKPEISKEEPKVIEAPKPEEPKVEPKPTKPPKPEDPKEDPKLTKPPEPQVPKEEPKKEEPPKVEAPKEEPKPSVTPNKQTIVTKSTLVQTGTQTSAADETVIEVTKTVTKVTTAAQTQDEPEEPAPTDRKKVLLVYLGLPRKTTDASIRDITVQAMNAQGCDVIVTDLVAQKFNPVLTLADIGDKDKDDFNYVEDLAAALDRGDLAKDILEEQAKVRAADLVIVHFQTLLHEVPALVLGWLQRVLLPKFAFDVSNGAIFDDGLLKGKRAMLSITNLGPSAAWSSRGILGDINVTLWPLQNGILRFCGFDVLKPHLTFNLHTMSAKDKATLISDFKARLQNIWTEEPISFISNSQFCEKNGWVLTDKAVSELLYKPAAPTIGQHLGRPLPVMISPGDKP